MIRKNMVLFVAGLCLIGGGLAQATDMTGRQIMEKQKELHKVKTEFGAEVMLLVDKDNNQERRQLRRYAKEMEKNLHRYLVAFLSPGDVKGTALLTWEQKGRENDQWLYLPAQKKMQRIAKGSKKNYFMGTDFTYEDMEPEDIDSFTYTVLRSEKLNHDGKDYDCYVIQAVPANEERARESGYSKRIMWIETRLLITLKAEFYDRRGRLQKTQTSHEFENIGGTVWRPKKTLMAHHEKNHKTLTGVTLRKVNETIDNAVFTDRFILSGKHTE